MKSFNINMHKEEEKLLKLQEKIVSFHSDKLPRKNLLSPSPKISSSKKTEKGTHHKKNERILNFQFLEKFPTYLG
jgi:hypothetical protein